MKRIRKTQNNVLLNLALLSAALLLTAGFALAESAIEWIGPDYPFDLSADGTAAAGNTAAAFNAFRWTKETGVVDLGMSTTEVFGSGAGTPNISDSGLNVSATVITPDSLYITQGLWTKGVGWEVSMPPIPPTGGVLDNSLGSCWGISGDGTTLTGFYWRPGNGGPQGSGTAHGNTWSTVDGFATLAPPLRNFRGNGLNYDGSVAVGWSERYDGVWCPTVWENDGFHVLHNQGISCQAEGVSDDGNIIWGAAQDTLTNIKSAALWLRTESGWDEQILGSLPGTFPNAGAAICNDRAENGSIIVGYNTYDGSPYNNSGFVWTLAEGMVSANDFFTSRGVVLPVGFIIDSLTAVSHNGNVIAGFGHNASVFPFVNEAFIITLDVLSSVPDVAGLRGMTLEPNYPNPFNPSTTIALSVEIAQPMKLEIFNARGQMIRQLHDGVLPVGRHEMVWDGRDVTGRQVASGIYFARALGENGTADSQRMVLVK
jgi:FlgD Ig-like domain